MDGSLVRLKHTAIARAYGEMKATAGQGTWDGNLGKKCGAIRAHSGIRAYSGIRV